MRDVQRNLPGGQEPRDPVLSFYSLSCETYSGTRRVERAFREAMEFLFAVVRDVQRNGRLLQTTQSKSFYSLSCETYSGTSSSRTPRAGPS